MSTHKIGTNVHNRPTKEDKLKRAVEIARQLDRVGQTLTLRVLAKRAGVGAEFVRDRLREEGLIHVVGMKP